MQSHEAAPQALSVVATEALNTEPQPASAPPLPGPEQPTNAQLPAPEIGGHAYVGKDGTVHTAGSVQEAQARCPVLGRMTPEQAAMIMKLASVGTEKKTTEAEPKTKPVVEKADVDQIQKPKPAPTEKSTSEVAATESKADPAKTAQPQKPTNKQQHAKPKPQVATPVAITKATPATEMMPAPSKTPQEPKPEALSTHALPTALQNESKIVAEAALLATATPVAEKPAAIEQALQPQSTMLTDEIAGHNRESSLQETVRREHQESVMWAATGQETVALIAKLEPRTMSYGDAVRELPLATEQSALSAEAMRFAASNTMPAAVEAILEPTAALRNRALLGRAALGESATNNMVDTVSTETVTTGPVIEPFDKKLGFFPEQITMSPQQNVTAERVSPPYSSRVIETYRLLTNSNASPGYATPKPPSTREFAAAMAEWPATEDPPTLATLQEQATDSNLEQTFVGLAELLREAGQEPAHIEIITLVHNIAAAMQDCYEATPEGSPVISLELTNQLITLLHRLGYKEPHQTLVQFVTTYDTEYLFQALRYICLMNDLSDSPEFLTTAPAQITTVDEDDHRLRLGKRLFGIISRFHPEFQVSA